jgi:glycosyltransferase involved in cell wall biosynthesis
MELFMRRSSAVLSAQGHDVEHLFEEDLGAPRVRGGLRRLAVHLLVLRAVLRRRSRTDVVEIHEPIAFGYVIVRKVLRTLPPCVVVSYGAEGRRWREQQERRRGALRSRLLVPTTLVWPARVAVRGADHVLAPSDIDLAYFRDELGVRAERMTRVDSGVDDACFDVARTEEDGPIRVLFIGTWIDRKGAPELAAAWRELLRRRPDVRLTATCTVVPEEVVRRDLPDAGVALTVSSFATRDELVADLASHDVFVLPSWFEGGISLGSLQAAAAGLACVATAISGNLDVFRAADPEADGALLVPVNDPKALAAALERLVGDRELVRRLGVAARERARAFPWTLTAERCLQAYTAATR